MTFLDVMFADGYIKLLPADSLGREGYVGKEWFAEKFTDIAQAKVPLSNEAFNQLKKIDKFWETNTEKWRREGII